MSWLKLKKTFDPDKPLYCESYRKLNVDLYLKLYNIIKNIQNEWLALHSIAQIKKFNIDYNKNIKDKVNKKGSSKRFNGWNLFIQEKYKTHKEKHNMTDRQKIMDDLKYLWKNKSKEDKEKYKTKAIEKNNESRFYANIKNKINGYGLHKYNYDNKHQNMDEILISLTDCYGCANKHILSHNNYDNLFNYFNTMIVNVDSIFDQIDNLIYNNYRRFSNNTEHFIYEDIHDNTIQKAIDFYVTEKRKIPDIKKYKSKVFEKWEEYPSEILERFEVTLDENGRLETIGDDEFIVENMINTLLHREFNVIDESIVVRAFNNTLDLKQYNIILLALEEIHDTIRSTYFNFISFKKSICLFQNVARNYLYNPDNGVAMNNALGRFNENAQLIDKT
jgi:hypothetical protein